MIYQKLFLAILIVGLGLMTSCDLKEGSIAQTETKVVGELPLKPKHNIPHSYGGWSCPDNLNGFPAVDIRDFDKVPVVNGRLPTKEETQNGTSLLYFNPASIPNAKPLDMTMPRLARYYSEYTKKNELVIVIQAVTADQDTVVGFRYLNGGNGSAWFDEVTFIADEELEALGDLRFVTFETEIKASQEEVWQVINNQVNANSISKKQDKDSGLLSAQWNNTYKQVDYNFDGRHYVEKFFLKENGKIGATQFQFVAGPLDDDFDAQKKSWEEWLERITSLCES